MSAEQSERRAWEAFEQMCGQMTRFDAFRSACAYFVKLEREREQMEACHCRVKAHLAEGRAQIKVDQYIVEIQNQARQS